jgi:small-conductance mechanosensitive channel
MTRRIETDGKFIGAIHFGELELLPRAAARDALRLFIFGALWLVRFGLFYFWILAGLSLFASTRPLAGRATGYLFAPALDLVGQMVARLPLLLALFLTFAVVLLLMRFVTLYCAAIERGEIHNAWIRPETARTSGTLLVAALSLAALLFVSPLFAGNADGSLPRIGLLLLGAIALGATPFLGSCLLGIRAVYDNAWRPGDRIEYGGQSGRVERLGLYDATLRGEDGAELRVPHLLSLWHPTRIYPADSRGASTPGDRGFTRAATAGAADSNRDAESAGTRRKGDGHDAD